MRQRFEEAVYKESNMAEQLKTILNAINTQSPLHRAVYPDIAEQLVRGQEQWRRQYPDIEWKLDKVVQKGNRVGFRYTAKGTVEGSKEKSTWTGSGIATVDDKGRLQHLRVQEDHWGRLIDQGIIPDLKEQDITGVWKGEVFGVGFQMNLKQTSGTDKVSGTISALGESLPLSGTNTPPTVDLAGKSPKGEVTFKGKWENDDTINGVINGAGFDNQSVQITRS
jgi:hypothetical protein